MGKNDNNKIRYNIVTIFIYIVGIILILQLFNLQIVHGQEYRETSNTRLTRESVLKAARGNILDSTGNKLVTSETSFSLELYKTKIEDSVLNNTILKTIKQDCLFILEFRTGYLIADNFYILISGS